MIYLLEKYRKEVVPHLMEKFGFKNIHEVPKIEKVVINCGVKEATQDSNELNLVAEVLTNIAGQKAVRTYAKRSIAGFKLREGMPIGVMVTLRGERMYDFLAKLVNIVLPAVRDFHGVSPKLDGRGSYNLGIRDWFVFPEVDYDKVETSRGMNITICTSTRNDEHARELLRALGMPFRKS